MFDLFAQVSGSSLAAVEIRPDFVFCDIGMPGMNGYEVEQRLRADASLPQSCRLIAVIGWGQARTQLAAQTQSA